MKVKLTKYENWYTSVNLENYLEERFNISEKWSKRICVPYQLLCDFLNIVKPKRKEYVKIDSWDTWNMNNTLSLIIEPMLIQLKETKHGAPMTDDADAPEHLRVPKNHTNIHDTDENHFERWDWIMDEMIWTFKEYNSDWESKFHSGTIDLDFDDPYLKGPKDTHVYDHEGHVKHVARMKNGFRLFGKYYMDLWD